LILLGAGGGGIRAEEAFRLVSAVELVEDMVGYGTVGCATSNERGKAGIVARVWP
jgi:hypothetical protein